jgi:hypothetical protein
MRSWKRVPRADARLIDTPQPARDMIRRPEVHDLALFSRCQCVEKFVTEIYVQFEFYVVSFWTLIFTPMTEPLDSLRAARLHTDFKI